MCKAGYIKVVMNASEVFRERRYYGRKNKKPHQVGGWEITDGEETAADDSGA